MKKIAAVIFDFDGVLVQSAEIKTEAFAKLFAPYGELVSKKVVDHHLLNGGVSRYEKIKFAFREIIKKPLSDELLNRLGHEYKNLVLNAVIEAPEVSGCTECLKQLSVSKKLFVVSGAPEDEVRQIATRRGISSFFEGIYGSPTLKVQHINRILEEHRWKADQVIFVGDSRTDYDAAHRTGIGFVGLCNCESRELWKQLKLGEQIDDLNQLAVMLASESPSIAGR